MLERFRDWYLNNQIEITWFLIGWLVMSGLDAFGRGNGIGALISFGFAYINYALYRR